jgi:hypothetical protein
MSTAFHNGNRGTGRWRELAALCVALALAIPASAAPRAGARVKRTDITACADVIQTGNASLSVQAPVLRYTLTSFDPNWFNPAASQQGAPLFTVRVAPQLLPYADRLTLRVHAWADTNLRGGGPLAAPVEVFDRTTTPLGAGNIGVPLTSGQVFGLEFQPGGGMDFRKSDLYGLVVERREVPQMNLHLEFSLFCSGAPVAENGVNVGFGATAKVRYVRTLRALGPGRDVTGTRPAAVFTLSPVFQISSDLFNEQAFEYAPGESRLEVFVYELEEGEKAAEAFRGMEFARFPASRPPVVYPADQPPLVPGRSYAWRVRALLRGPESRYTYSNGLYFRVDPRLDNGVGGASPEILSEPPVFPGQTRYGSDYSKRVLAALRIILGENFDLVAGPGKDKIPAEGLIRVNGRPLSLEELERLARDFGGSKYRMTRLRFE